MQEEPNPFLQFMETESLLHVFFHHHFTLSLASKNENSNVLNSFSRHDDVKEYKDMMT